MKWNDDDLDRTLNALRDDGQIPDAALTAVRARVMSQVQARRAKWWRWAWVPALAAALSIVAIISRRPAPVIAPPPLIASAPAAQPMQPAPKFSPRPAPKPAQVPTETQFARILTDDPNVVVLWAMNSEGATR